MVFKSCGGCASVSVIFVWAISLLVLSNYAELKEKIDWFAEVKVLTESFSLFK